MHKLSHLIKKHTSSSSSTSQRDLISTGDVTHGQTEEFPSSADLFRYRKHCGVNLGSWFVLERWITESPFRLASQPAQSDLDVARGRQAKEILEQHWDTWITVDDWTWIAERGLNAIRIPIGYYHLCGADPTVLPNTDFAELDHVYHGAWGRLTNAISTANRFGLGVLLDLHAAPGKQNRDSHSGATGEPRFFTKSNMKHTIHVLTVLVTQLNAFCNSFHPPLPNVLGIELLNEPQQDPALEKWYKDAIHAIRDIDPSIPIYIGDSWATDQYASFIESNGPTYPFTVLDHHLYRCFTHEDTTTTVAEHVRNLTDPNAGTPQLLGRVSQKLEAAGGALIIGEWSGALNPGSMQGAGNEVAARRDYVQAQLALFERHCAGYFFWTYKKEQTGDKGWSLVDAVDAGVFPSRIGLSGRDVVLADESAGSVHRDRARDKALDDHTRWWSQWPGHYEHWRFDDGFVQGWNDAWVFFKSIATLPASSSVPELGFRGPWLKRRAREHATVKGGNNLWEFEHGFSQGLQAARSDLSERL